MPRRGVYPGSFNPPTTAHVAIAAAARDQRNLDEVVLMQSRRPLGKDEVERPVFDDRVQVLAAVADEISWLSSDVTDDTLLVDIAAGFDVVIMGADKWHQIHEVAWYDDEAARDRAVALLPDPVVAPRPPLTVPDRVRLHVAADVLDQVSSTAARAGRLDLFAPAARRFAEETGAWVDPARYERFLLSRRPAPRL